MEQFARSLSLTNGGRALNAIKHLTNKRLGSHERHVLLILGSELNFTGDFTDTRWITLTTLVEMTGISRAGVKRALDRLLDPEGVRAAQAQARDAGLIAPDGEPDPYIIRRADYDPVTGQQRANHYGLTTRVFREYAALLAARETRETVVQGDPGGGSPRPGGGFKVNRGGVQGEPHNTCPNTSHNTSNNKFYARARVDKKTNASVSVLAEAREARAKRRLETEAEEIGEQVYVPVDPGDRGSIGEGRPRFVPLRALKASMRQALEDLGIDSLRLGRDRLRRRGRLGQAVFDPNEVTAEFRRWAEAEAADRASKTGV